MIPTKSIPVPDHAKQGKQCRAWRKERKLTLRQVADIMGLGKTYVHDLEHGRRNWTPELVEDYKKATGK